MAIVKRETRKIKRQCWETFVLRIEHDLHGRQINAYKIIRNLNKTVKKIICDLTFWRRNYFFLILTRPVYKM